MPIRYHRDDSRRRVVVTVEGAVEPADALAVIERQRLEDAWSYGLLYDLRLMTLTIEVFRERNEAEQWLTAQLNGTARR
jgi:hypothetical protein